MIPEALGPAAEQDGVVSRRQLRALGVTDGRIRAQVDAGRWQRLSPGVYATSTGRMPPRAWVWAALLHAGAGAIAGPMTTLWLVGALDRPPAKIDVLVPEARRVRALPWMTVTRRHEHAAREHGAASPPRMRLEDALLDVCDACRRPEEVVDLVLRVVQRRRSTAHRIAARLAARSRHRWRALLGELLADVEDGVRSALERRWLRGVAGPHRLPPARLNLVEQQRGSSRYRDVAFEDWPLVVELDGREAHPDHERFRDRRRDNYVMVSGRHTLRYGWHEIVEDPCGVAGEVATVLSALGWTGRPHPCAPTCPAATAP